MFGLKNLRKGISNLYNRAFNRGKKASDNVEEPELGVTYVRKKQNDRLFWRQGKPTKEDASNSDLTKVTRGQELDLEIVLNDQGKGYATCKQDPSLKYIVEEDQDGSLCLYEVARSKPKVEPINPWMTEAHFGKDILRTVYWNENSGEFQEIFYNRNGQAVVTNGKDVYLHTVEKDGKGNIVLGEEPTAKVFSLESALKHLAIYS